MKRMARGIGIDLKDVVIIGFAMAMGCASSEPKGEAIGHSNAALSGSTLQLIAQTSSNGYVGSPVFLWESLYNVDPSAVHNDVTLTTTIAGSFSSVDLVSFGYDTWACSQTSAPGLTTITCHGDTVTLKDGFNLSVTPTGAGTLTVDSRLTEGGTAIGLFHAGVPITVATSADLGVSGWNTGGIINVGQSVALPYYAYNNGPLAATGAMVTFSLTGPGKFTSAFGTPPGPPPPPTDGGPWEGGAPTDGGVEGGGPPPQPNYCTFTDTTATCAIGNIEVHGSRFQMLGFQGTGDGLVTVTASIAGNEPDDAPWNNTTTSNFTLVTPRVADLAVSITAPSPVTFKKPLTYTIVVKDNGPDAAGDAILGDYLPTTMTFGSVTTTQGSCSGGSGYLFCDLGRLAAGASATVTLVATPTEGGEITNNAYVYDPAWATDTDPHPSNNSATITTTVRGPNPPVTTTATNGKYDGSFFEYVPCANEYVSLEGTYHYSYHTTYNSSSGHAKYDSMSHPSDVKGVGLNSGTTYLLTGTSSYSSSYGNGFPSSFDYQEVRHLVGKGAGSDLFVHVLNHATFASDGTPKVSVSKTWFTCK